jgi:hypothetical protein
VPGARHAIMPGEEAEVRRPEPAVVGAAGGGETTTTGASP